MENDAIKTIVDHVIQELNNKCKELNVRYNEQLHDKLIETFENIAETEYRKWLGI